MKEVINTKNFKVLEKELPQMIYNHVITAFLGVYELTLSINSSSYQGNLYISWHRYQYVTNVAFSKRCCESFNCYFKKYVISSYINHGRSIIDSIRIQKILF